VKKPVKTIKVATKRKKRTLRREYLKQLSEEGKSIWTIAGFVVFLIFALILTGVILMIRGL